MLIDLPDDTMALATEQATADGLTVSAWIRLAIQDSARCRIPNQGFDDMGFPSPIIENLQPAT